MNADRFMGWLEGFLDANDGQPLLAEDVAKIRAKMGETYPKHATGGAIWDGVGIRAAAGAITSAHISAKGVDAIGKYALNPEDANGAIKGFELVKRHIRLEGDKS